VRTSKLMDGPPVSRGLLAGRSRRAPGGAHDDAGVGANDDSLTGATAGQGHCGRLKHS
jgi:hypothetical protein